MRNWNRSALHWKLLDKGAVQVKAVPNVLLKQMNARSLRDLLAGLIAAENQGHGGTWEEHALANVACKAAIKANYFLTVSEMREMIEQLEQTKAPYSCCHGRPTMVQFSLSALEREFGEALVSVVPEVPGLHTIPGVPSTRQHPDILCELAGRAPVAHLHGARRAARCLAPWTTGRRTLRRATGRGRGLGYIQIHPRYRQHR